MRQNTDMKAHLLIFGYGYTAHYLAKKAQQLPIQVTATSRNSAVLGFDSHFNCEVIGFTEKAVACALEKTTHILVCTPPNPDNGDPVLEKFTPLLKQATNHIEWIGYLSSTSVYGDHQGAWVNELSQAKHPGEQGNLRLAAENQWIAVAQFYQRPLNIFRLAGIYGPQRNVLSRLLAGKKETVVKKGHFFSRIHVEDIALAILSAMQKSQQGVEIYNVADDEPAPSYIVDEYAASLLQLPPLIQIPYVKAILSPMAQEFYSHNKKVSNTKLKKHFNLQLTYPTYKDGLNQLLHTKEYLCQ